MPPFSDQPSAHPSPAREDSVTLTCPGCNTTLQTDASRSVDGPCPICGTPLHYEAPSRAELAPFQPLRHHSHHSRKSASGGARTPHPKRVHRTSFRKAIHNANEFINTRNGKQAAVTVLVLLMVFCVHLFIKRDDKLRRQATPDEPIETVGTGSEPTPSPIPVALPIASPDEAAPDPFTLAPGQVIEVRKPAR